METYTPDSLFSGSFPVATGSVTIAAGADLVRGAVLGKITASGKYALSAIAASDGSETPVAILLEDAAAASEDVVAPVAFTGQFNPAALTFGTDHDADTVWDDLRSRGIFLKEVVSA